jgi:hypothetical protein
MWNSDLALCGGILRREMIQVRKMRRIWMWNTLPTLRPVAYGRVGTPTHDCGTLPPHTACRAQTAG